MLKKLAKFRNGQSQTNPLLLFGVLFLVGAIIVVAVFILVLNKQRETGEEGSAAEDITKPATGQTGETGDGATDEAREREVVRQTILGVLNQRQDNQIILIEKNSQNRITVSLQPETNITYNGAPFSSSRFYPGDELQIQARRAAGGWLAETIIVLVSASPQTPAPTPPAINARPDGTIKPL